MILLDVTSTTLARHSKVVVERINFWFQTFVFFEILLGNQRQWFELCLL